MKINWLIVFSVSVASAVHAATPSKQLIYSCLSSEPTVSSIHLTVIPTTEILEEDDYLPGYRANYFQFKGKDVGYAVSGTRNGIVYSKRIYLLAKATRLLTNKVIPVEINPNLANFSILSDAKGRYLCVSDNLDGIGRSGSYQNVRYGYLLSLNKEKKLYFAADDIRNFKKNP